MSARGWAESNGDTDMHLLGEEEAAKRLSVSVRTLQRWRRTGDGPQFTRLGVRRLGYSEAELSAWAAARTYRHRADELSRQAA